MFPIFIAEVFVTDLTMPISDVSCFFDGLYLAVDLGQLMAGCRKISDLFGIRIGPVSYTHLDVYKRQVPPHAVHAAVSSLALPQGKHHRDHPSGKHLSASDGQSDKKAFALFLKEYECFRVLTNPIRFHDKEKVWGFYADCFLFFQIFGNFFSFLPNKRKNIGSSL